jgi:hypothetical protein
LSEIDRKFPKAECGVRLRLGVGSENREQVAAYIAEVGDPQSVGVTWCGSELKAREKGAEHGEYRL